MDANLSENHCENTLLDMSNLVPPKVPSACSPQMSITRIDYDQYPGSEEFDGIVQEYLGNLSTKKRDKALVDRKRYSLIFRVLKEPRNTSISTAQFRFWVKKMFQLRANVVCHDNKPVAMREQIYDILVKAHRKARHGGRDKTSALVRRKYSWIPKELIARFVRHCPFCTSRRNGISTAVADVVSIDSPATPPLSFSDSVLALCKTMSSPTRNARAIATSAAAVAAAAATSVAPQGSSMLDLTLTQAPFHSAIQQTMPASLLWCGLERNKSWLSPALCHTLLTPGSSTLSDLTSFQLSPFDAFQALEKYDATNVAVAAAAKAAAQSTCLPITTTSTPLALMQPCSPPSLMSPDSSGTGLSPLQCPYLSYVPSFTLSDTLDSAIYEQTIFS